MVTCAARSSASISAMPQPGGGGIAATDDRDGGVAPADRRRRIPRSPAAHPPVAPAAAGTPGRREDQPAAQTMPTSSNSLGLRRPHGRTTGGDVRPPRAQGGQRVQRRGGGVPIAGEQTAAGHRPDALAIANKAQALDVVFGRHGTVPGTGRGGATTKPLRKGYRRRGLAIVKHFSAAQRPSAVRPPHAGVPGHQSNLFHATVVSRGNSATMAPPWCV